MTLTVCCLGTISKCSKFLVYHSWLMSSPTVYAHSLPAFVVAVAVIIAAIVVVGVVLAVVGRLASSQAYKRKIN